MLERTILSHSSSKHINSYSDIHILCHSSCLKESIIFICPCGGFIRRVISHPVLLFLPPDCWMAYFQHRIQSKIHRVEENNIYKAYNNF